eukprot:3555687-Amphidinium_carterae.1
MCLGSHTPPPRSLLVHAQSLSSSVPTVKSAIFPTTSRHAFGEGLRSEFSAPDLARERAQEG